MKRITQSNWIKSFFFISVALLTTFIFSTPSYTFPPMPMGSGDITAVGDCTSGACFATLDSTEVGIIDGATLSTTDINIINGISDSGSLTAAELLYVDGVTSAIQTQIDAKMASTLLKDLVAGTGLSGGSNDILPGADADVTLAVDLTEITGNQSWNDGATDASFTVTYNLSAGTDPVWTIGNNSVDLTTGVLKVGGSTVLTSLGLPKDYITGLVISQDIDTDHDVNITAGEARDATDAQDIVLSSEITKQIDAAWAVGDDAGGLDTGTVGNSTLYAIWLIKRSDTGVVDALFSTSFTAPTMPTNYDYKRLIGWVLTNGSANIEPFIMTGSGRVKRIQYNSPILIASGLNQTGYTAQSIASQIPVTLDIMNYELQLIRTAGNSVLVNVSYDGTNQIGGGYFTADTQSMVFTLIPNGNNFYYKVDIYSVVAYMNAATVCL